MVTPFKALKSRQLKRTRIMIMITNTMTTLVTTGLTTADLITAVMVDTGTMDYMELMIWIMDLREVEVQAI